MELTVYLPGVLTSHASLFGTILPDVGVISEDSKKEMRDIMGIYCLPMFSNWMYNCIYKMVRLIPTPSEWYEIMKYLQETLVEYVGSIHELPPTLAVLRRGGMGYDGITSILRHFFFARVSQRICPTALTGRCIKIKYAVIPVLDQYMIYLYWQRSLGRRISTLILVG